MLALSSVAFAQSASDFVLGGAFAGNNARPAHVATPVQQGVAQMLVNGSDSCSTPDAITGTGAFNFDNSAATTGTDGQVTTNCIQSNIQGISNDVWFLWTAPSSGQVELSSCGVTTVDTKIAVYNGSTCPAAGATALDCNDDLSVNAAGTQGFNFQSKVFWTATAGNQYLIQLGVSPGVPGGAGTFTITYASPDFPMPIPCGADDGNSETLQGWIANISVCAMQRQGGIGQTTNVGSISVAWGAPFAPAANNPPNGGTGTVAIWNDPNDDGDPTDAVLVQMQTATIAATGTDTLEVVNLVPPVTMTGVFFVGAVWTTSATTNQANAPFSRDNDSCGYAPRRSWLAINQATTFNFTTLTANTVPPTPWENSGLDPLSLRGNFLLRADCAAATIGTAFCAGDGIDAGVTTACPCSNFGGAGNGCASSFNSAGAHIDATGMHDATTDAVSFQGTGMNASGNCIFFKGNTEAVGGAVFGDGITCVGGTLVRFAASALTAGSASYPVGAQPLISVRGGTPPGSGIQAWYGAFYRNAAAAFCPPFTFNCTNSYTITW